MTIRRSLHRTSPTANRRRMRRHWRMKTDRNARLRIIFRKMGRTCFRKMKQKRPRWTKPLHQQQKMPCSLRRIRHLMRQKPGQRILSRTA